jgi:hypothetical protein
VESPLARRGISITSEEDRPVGGDDERSTAAADAVGEGGTGNDECGDGEGNEGDCASEKPRG